MVEPFAATSQKRLQFVSLGMVVLDELHFPESDSLYDVLGGSGTYATLGARMTTGASHSQSVAFIILTGDDFPASALDRLDSWDLSLAIHDIPGAKSTRISLTYHDVDFGHKTHQYLSTPLQPTPKHLEESHKLHTAAFHLHARPQDLEVQIEDLLSRRSQHKIADNPLLVWEPTPLHCTFEEGDAHVQACKLVDVCSPNHIELAQLFKERVDPEESFCRSKIETYASRLRLANPRVKVVIRAGEHGCFITSQEDEACWLPTFYDPSSRRVVDPTGAGNAFLGAFTVVLLDSGKLREAAIYGSVAASFALEQIGLPNLGSSDGMETWNGTQFAARLEEYRRGL